MAARTLGELEKSKLLNELELMPGEEKHRIHQATNAGRVLDDAHERDIQRALLARMPWARWGLALLYCFLAVMNWGYLADGSRSGVLAWLAAISFTAFATVYVRRWLHGHRLDALLAREDGPRVAPSEAPRAEPEDTPKTSDSRGRQA